ncbi:fatty acid oxidation complex subunit alpha FadB [Neptunicella marina]|uniref:enoyl-CoA hydratase n=1 Tax=Neptunicella marina TaxID=2125989 RepID=A0A8J6IUJ1_9ALTE|nr:fatty acid oxidation complex subunit alpha FadB [Neptunicella marina]MBC3765733.1 fatty acid oxidation complex subunit alpha FadB [Neptunicella marina]
MLYQGQKLSATLLEDGIAEILFDADGSVNKFDRQTVSEMSQMCEQLSANSEIKGAIVRSTKPVFIVGADITEFGELFALPDDEIVAWIAKTSHAFDQVEDLPFPTVVAIDGFALGGGCELTLACDLRVAGPNAQIGLPEVKLGLMPGFGGTVRLPRLIGADNAMEWMSLGNNHDGQAALAVGAVDAVVSSEKLIDAALSMVKDAIAGKINWQARRAQKQAPLKLNKNESAMCFATAKAMVAAKAGKHYPAPHLMVDTIAQASTMDRAGALALENKNFVVLAKTDAAKAQIGIFMADQLVKSKGKKQAKTASKAINQAAVLGAGIMGGGIAYQSAVKGTPTVMKDINQAALDLGLKEASGILQKGMARGKVSPAKMASTLTSIVPTLEYSAIEQAAIVVEAVVENPKVKQSVLAEVEQHVADDAIICSNTSTISIDLLAESLKKPQRFCGMHFFNPVHRMPLVEIIRGEKTSDDTIAAVVAYSLKMGKTPIVVNDCPGFLVNRVLFPYFAGFSQLVLDGADFTAVDKVMEKQFGWPMGPAYLLDVVGLDTADHAAGVMADGFPERMQKIDKDPVALLYQANRLGQKNGGGFYNYSTDKRGRPQKDAAPEAYALIENTSADFDAETIIARLMIPMANEAVRCLEEGIVASAAEADMALLYGLGFPPFRGGIFRYMDTLGLAKFVELADSFAHLGSLYQVTDGLREKAKNGETYLGQ